MKGRVDWGRVRTAMEREKGRVRDRKRERQLTRQEKEKDRKRKVIMRNRCQTSIL